LYKSFPFFWQKSKNLPLPPPPVVGVYDALLDVGDGLAEYLVGVEEKYGLVMKSDVFNLVLRLPFSPYKYELYAKLDF
jgi:hypothetical protein